MPQSTLTDKGQTTVPIEVRQALRLKPRHGIDWEIQADGSVTVRRQPSALDLFATLKPSRPFPGIKEEKEAVRRLMAEQASKEGLR